MSVSNTQDPAVIYDQAVAALNRGQWPQAQQLAMGLLRQHPGHGGIPFVAGVASLQLEQVPLAVELLKRAAQISPHRADYAAQFARSLSVARFMREASLEAGRAWALGPSDGFTWDTLGVVYSQANDYDKAAQAFRHAVAAVPDNPTFLFNLATAQTFAGELEQAEANYLACLRQSPRHWKAYLALAQLRRQRPEANHVAWLEERLATVGDDAEGRMYLQLALSKEHEDLGEHGPAFDYLSRGKAATRTLRNYHVDRDVGLFRKIEEASTGMPHADGHASDEPIFIIGMPRSGTTLVDRILSSHPDVQSAGELQNFSVAFKRAGGSRTPSLLDEDAVAHAARIDWAKLGADYIDSTRPLTGSHRHFTDKLPHNFLYAGFIARALPNARIICLHRGAMDTCLSNFRQLFALSSPYYDYSFDLMDTGRYFLLFQSLMRHWHRQFPGRILDVHYEQLVDDQEHWTRKLLEFCGLPWDEACLRFEQNAAPVATASAVQVRSAMNRKSIQRWKKYQPWLGDLQALLAEAGVDVDA